MQRALNVVRVTGNEAVHPGQIDTGDADTAARLFELVNLIVDAVIAQPRRIDGLYDRLPSDKREQIERRNARARERRDTAGGGSCPQP